MGKGLHQKWMYTVMPYAAIGSGLSVIIPLYILSLKGTVFDVGIALSIYYLVSVPSSIIWGRLTDKIGRARMFILLSLFGTLPVILIIYLMAHIVLLEFDYGLYALVATAASPSLNILVMGTRKNPNLPKYFSRYSIISIIGTIIAFAAGIFVSYDYIHYYLDFLLALNIVALVLSYIFVKSIPKKAVSKERLSMASRMFALLNSLSFLPHLMTGTPLVERIQRSARIKRVKRIYTLFIAISLFNLGSAVFNTSYIPYLRSFGIAYGNVFLINLLNGLAQLLIYAVVLVIAKRIDIGNYYKTATALRSASYLIAIVPIFVLTGVFLQLNIILYFMAGIAYAYWNISSSVMVYNNVRGGHKGYYLGMWAAIIGLSSVIGAFVSGVISAGFSYPYTFLLAAALTVVSLSVFSKC